MEFSLNEKLIEFKIKLNSLRKLQKYFNYYRIKLKYNFFCKFPKQEQKQKQYKIN